jgi:hypothetical protein
MLKLQICSENFRKWKTIALTTNNLRTAQKAFKRAFFWLELFAAFSILRILEENGKNKDLIAQAKLKICERLLNYADHLLNELKREFGV